MKVKSTRRKTARESGIEIFLRVESGQLVLNCHLLKLQKFSSTPRFFKITYYNAFSNLQQRYTTLHTLPSPLSPAAKVSKIKNQELDLLDYILHAHRIILFVLEVLFGGLGHCQRYVVEKEK